jgi:hypothetical protein
MKGAFCQAPFLLLFDVLPVANVATTKAVADFVDNLTSLNQFVQLGDKCVLANHINPSVIGATHLGGVDGARMVGALDVNSVSVSHDF